MKLPELGEMFEGRYRVDSVLGEGGFAVVYGALDVTTARLVALKVLKPDRGDGYDAATSARFAREVLLLGQLRDPHTVRLFGSGESATGALYMVFEHVPGRDLSEYLDTVERLEPRWVVHILRQVLASLREAHERGLIHRDLKPENIRIYEANGDPMTVKLLDFGIARATDEGHPSITRTGELVGTPRYMSPEQITERPLSPASDIYSLGMVGLELLVGRAALPGNQWSDQFERLMSGHVFSIPESQRIGMALIAIIQRMSARKPEDRYASAGAVLAALDALERPVVPHSGLTSTPTPAGLPNWVLVAVVVCVLVAGAAALVLREEPPATSPMVPANTSTLIKPEPSAHRAPDPAPVVTPAVDACGKEWLEDGPYRNGDHFIYVPPDYEPRRRHPVVILVHGESQRPEDLLKTTGLMEMANRERFVVIAPIDPPGPAWRDGDLDERRIKNAFDVAAAELCLDRRQVFVIGHGQGGRMANALSCRDWVTAVAFHDYVYRTNRDESPFECPGQPAPAIWLTPRDSVVVPVDGKPNCLRDETHDDLPTIEGAWRERNKCMGPPTLEEYPHGTCSSWGCEAPLRSCRLDGGAGWDPDHPFAHCPGEPAPSAFDSTSVIWNFFQRVAPRGCGQPPRLDGNGDDYVWLPDSYDPDHRHPLVVMLHDDVQAPRTLVTQTKMRELAEREGIVIVAPESPLQLPTDAFERTNSWRDDDRSVEKVRQSVRAVRAGVCIDPDRVFVLGNGEGGRAATALSCEPWVRAVAVTSHLFHSAVNPFGCERPSPALWITPRGNPNLAWEPAATNCGDDDSLENLEKAWRRRNRCKRAATKTDICEAWSQCDAPFESCLVAGGDPFPAAQAVRLMRDCPQQPPSTFAAGAHIWSFFERVSREEVR